MNRLHQEWLRLCEAFVLNAADAIVITEAGVIGPRGPRIVFANEAFARMTGYRPEEVIGKTPRILQGEKTQRDELERIRKALEKQEPVHAELINYRKDGTEFWTDVYIAPLRNEEGRVTHWAAAKRDITRRKSIEEALRRSESTNRALLDALPDMLFRLSRQGVYLDFKPAKDFAPLVPPPQFLGRKMPEVLPPAVARRAMQALEAAFESGETQVFEYQLPYEDSLCDYEARLVVSGLDEAVVLVRDVTGRKRLEEQLRQAQKMEAVGRLAGGVAHDFNNFLTVIEGYAQMMFDSVGEASPLRGELQEILRAADRAATLTERLLSFSRHRAAPLSVVRLNAVVAGMEKLLQRVMGGEVELAAVLRPDVGSLKAHEGQVEQILLNLALNARDAMSGGGRLTIETGNVELTEDYACAHPGVTEGPYVMLAVSDTGHGMDQATRSHLFEPFFTTKEPGKGTGLGMSTIYAIVHQLDGSIDVVSEPAKGTQVRIYLPREMEAASEEVSRPSPAARPLQGAETVLLVEDEAGVRQLLREVLERSGYLVIEARGPIEALDAGARHGGPIGLLLTDVVMPRMSGGELARRIREQRPGLKVLYISGYADDESLRRHNLEDGEAFLQKPFTPEVLLGKLREILEAAGAGRRKSATRPRRAPRS